MQTQQSSEKESLFTCKRCQKQYNNFTAVYNHIKNNHKEYKQSHKVIQGNKKLKSWISQLIDSKKNPEGKGPGRPSKQQKKEEQQHNNIQTINNGLNFHNNIQIIHNIDNNNNMNQNMNYKMSFNNISNNNIVNNHYDQQLFDFNENFQNIENSQFQQNNIIENNQTEAFNVNIQEQYGQEEYKNQFESSIQSDINSLSTNQSVQSDIHSLSMIDNVQEPLSNSTEEICFSPKNEEKNNDQKSLKQLIKKMSLEMRLEEYKQKQRDLAKKISSIEEQLSNLHL